MFTLEANLSWDTHPFFIIPVKASKECPMLASGVDMKSPASRLSAGLCASSWKWFAEMNQSSRVLLGAVSHSRNEYLEVQRDSKVERSNSGLTWAACRTAPPSQDTNLCRTAAGLCHRILSSLPVRAPSLHKTGSRCSEQLPPCPGLWLYFATSFRFDFKGSKLDMHMLVLKSGRRESFSKHARALVSCCYLF